ncbi:hypothetical protein LX36DRAFT_672930 [Colletotrichum falcatum]|nr:hypothetical protein LX36DRAFT_672930 [Colletotrichum falcatum]
MNSLRWLLSPLTGGVLPYNGRKVMGSVRCLVKAQNSSGVPRTEARRHSDATAYVYVPREGGGCQTVKRFGLLPRLVLRPRKECPPVVVVVVVVVVRNKRLDAFGGTMGWCLMLDAQQTAQRKRVFRSHQCTMYRESEGVVYRVECCRGQVWRRMTEVGGVRRRDTMDTRGRVLARVSVNQRRVMPGPEWEMREKAQIGYSRCVPRVEYFNSLRRMDENENENETETETESEGEGE